MKPPARFETECVGNIAGAAIATSTLPYPKNAVLWHGRESADQAQSAQARDRCRILARNDKPPSRFSIMVNHGWDTEDAYNDDVA